MKSPSWRQPAGSTWTAGTCGTGSTLNHTVCQSLPCPGRTDCCMSGTWPCARKISSFASNLYFLCVCQQALKRKSNFLHENVVISLLVENKNRLCPKTCCVRTGFQKLEIVTIMLNKVWISECETKQAESPVEKHTETHVCQHLSPPPCGVVLVGSRVTE